MSLEQQIAALVDASNNLTGAVNSKLGEIDAAVAAAVKAIPDLSRIFYVDAVSGNDNALGTEQEPLKTIYEALTRSADIPFVTILLKRSQTHEFRGDNNNVCYRVIRNQTVFGPYGSGERPVFTPKVGNFVTSASNLHFMILESGSVFFRGVKLVIPNELLPGTTGWYSGFGGSLFFRGHGTALSQEGSVIFGDSEIVLGGLPVFFSGYTANYRLDLLYTTVNADLSSNFVNLSSSTMIMSAASSSVTNGKIWKDLFKNIAFDGSGSPVNFVSNIAADFFAAPEGA
ncbi:hypothetical protein MYC06_004700 [Vibrio parahaemolyticus]|nr:hypothetical protein [Vibrio parahaemolyticus]EJC7066866.1 hypothetical protein [Vibrio parahaemolyticus]